MFRLNPGFFLEVDAMTTLFLMKIGKECFFKLVRCIFFLYQCSGSCARDQGTEDGRIFTLTLLFFFRFPRR